MMIPIALIIGIAALAISVWLRSGSSSSRWWIGGNGIVDVRLAFATFPGLAGILIGAAFCALGGHIPETSFLHKVLFIIGLIIVAIGLILSILGFLRRDLPIQLLPRWYRELED